MTCKNHPQTEAVTNCSTCGAPICADCTIRIEDKEYCETHALKQLQQDHPPFMTTKDPDMPTHYSYTTVYPYKNRVTATLLCLFLGWMGAHRYYLGKTATAVVYTFSFGLFGVGWLIDLLILIAGNPRDQRGQPLT